MQRFKELFTPYFTSQNALLRERFALFGYIHGFNPNQTTFPMKLLVLFGLMLILLAGCASDEPAETPEYAIVLHGGAGVISRDIDDETRDGFLNALSHALELGKDMLENGADALDVVVEVIKVLEDEPRFNAGRGAVMTNVGTFELDASIMDGRNLAAGAVAGIKTVKNPIVLARHVMEGSPHVLFAGAGAEQFADLMEVERVEQDWFRTERRARQLERAQQADQVILDNSKYSRVDDYKMGTVGVAVLDKNGNLAAGTSTGGMTNKRFGRVGDSPIIGAGTYADNNTCAISATGRGEEFIRHAVAYQISAIMEYTGATLQEAAETVIHGKLQPNDGGIIGVSRTGEIVMVFNSPGMFRGAADSFGRFEVKIWD